LIVTGDAALPRNASGGCKRSATATPARSAGRNISGILIADA
jgi:hypothetical protein